MSDTKDFFSIEVLEQWVSSKLATLASTNSKRSAKRDVTGGSASDRAPKFEAVAGGCAWVASCQSNDRLPEPEWYALASIAGNCHDGQRIFHEISAQDARYDERETETKLQHALTSAGPRSCTNIEEQIGHSACKTCPFRGKISSPIELGYQDPNIVELMANHVLIVDQRKFLNLRTGDTLLGPSFTDKYRHLTGDKTPHLCLTSNRLARKVDSLDYVPGERDLFFEKNGKSVVNMWKPGKVKPDMGDCSTILDHIENLIPDEVFRNHFLNCVATLFKNPGQKINHVLLIVGSQGTGKSLINQLLMRLIGDGNYVKLEGEQLASRWTAGAGNVQLAIIEEMMTFEKMEVYNRIKTWVTDRTLRVEEKGLPLYYARTPDMFIGTSNHDSPINLERDDRRFAVFKSPMGRREADYYTRLASAIETEAAAFLHYLLNRDLASFNPSAPPPMTEAKQELINWSFPQATQEILAMAEEGDVAFWADLVTVDDLREALGVRLRKTPSRHEVVRGLRQLGAKPLEKPVRMGSLKTARLWAWRNVDKWEEAEPQAIREHYVDFRKKPNEDS